MIGSEFCEELGGEAHLIRTEEYNPDEFVCTVDDGDPYEDEDRIFSYLEGGTDFECGPAEFGE